MQGINGKVHVITGGASGIGLAISRVLAKKKAIVALTDINEAAATKAAHALSEETGATVVPYHMDVRSSQQVDAVAKRVHDDLGPVKGLAANAGYVEMHPALDFPDRAWEDIIGVNLTGVFYCCRAFGAQMRGRNGSIVITSSIAATKVVRPERTVAYGAAKAGAAHMASLLGVEWAKDGIRVNSVAPGYTATPMVLAQEQLDPGMTTTWLTDQPIGRFIEPDEIAQTFAFLLSDLSSGITGARIDVDGGYTKG